jgi:hypothetical protein
MFLFSFYHFPERSAVDVVFFLLKKKVQLILISDEVFTKIKV